MQEEYWHKFLNIAHFVGLSILLAALPLSNFFMSIGIFWLAAVWLLKVLTDLRRGSSLKRRWSRLLNQKSALLIMGIFAWPLLGMLWTEDYAHGWWDIRMKLPLLLVPFLLVTMDEVSVQKQKYLKGIFLISLLFAVTYCLFIYWGVVPKKFNDVREISVFISHIRFSLLLITGLIIAYHEAWHKTEGKVLCLALTGYFVYFLMILSSLTGLVTLTLISIWALYHHLFRHQNKKIIWTATLALGLGLSTGAFLLINYANTYLKPTASENSSDYGGLSQYNLIERGKYVHQGVDRVSVVNAWNERSTKAIESNEGQTTMLFATLIRYLTCKDLPKTAEGVFALTQDDVLRIEAGQADCLAEQRSPLLRRIDDVLFEIAVVRAGGNNSGHSVLQRLEFWRAGLHIIAKHPWLGVGTGDTKAAFAESYREINTKLEAKYRLRAHNQFLTMFITYGIFGFLYFVLLMVHLIYVNRHSAHRSAFVILAILSMLTEDTLESQAGVMFFAVFAIFLTYQHSGATEPQQQAQ